MSAMSAGTCKMMSYVEMLTALASVINLSAVSIERFGPLFGKLKEQYSQPIGPRNARGRKCNSGWSDMESMNWKTASGNRKAEGVNTVPFIYFETDLIW
jgi:hypothetical protein